MANIKSAKKRIRRTSRQRDRNRTLRSQMRTAIRDLRQAVATGDAAGAQEMLRRTLGIVDSTARKGVIHANTAARTKSRLTRAVATI